MGIAGIVNPDGVSEERYPIYNVNRPADSPGLFAFNVLGVVVRLTPTVRPGDYGITMDSGTIAQGVVVNGADVTLWGVPADPIHDAERYGPLFGGLIYAAPAQSQSPRVPFLSTSSSCSGAPEVITAHLDGWDSIGQYATRSFSSDFDGRPFINTGCDRLAFSPSIDVSPGSHAAGSPSGLSVDLKVPQSEAPDGLATADVRDVDVTLPNGVSLSPSAASGLGACTDAEVALPTSETEQCPDSSKLGTVEVDSPLLSEPLLGSVYLGSQQSDDPQSGRMYRLFLVVAGSGVRIKLEGAVKADPVTGQLTTTFSENPQLPFSELKLNLDSGPGAPLSTPSTCGVYASQVRITSWSGKTVNLSSPFTVNQNCQAATQFTPSLEAGVTEPGAGRSSTFVLNLSRPDGQQNIGQLSVTLPKGQLANLAGVPLCGDAEASTGNCPARSQVGTTTIAAGPGSNPISVPQPGKAPTGVYLAGPYKGAPYSLVVKVPAQAGPFDLGTVTVRNALRVDSTTTQVTAVSDPLPQILKGIPLTYQKINVTIDRPGFIQNPTNCDPTEVTSTIVSAEGAVAHPSNRYQVANCASLGFKPKLALSLKGGTTRAKNPALKAVLTAPAGQANIGKVQVILPKSVFIDNRHIGNPCTRVQFNAGAGNGAECPAKSILGRATAYTPLLDRPLKGKVYFRSNGSERELPDLVASLDGQIHVNLVGFIDSVGRKGSNVSRVRNTFASVPDAPVSKFVLELDGGKKGLLQNSTNLCKTTNRATVKMDGQNGKTHDFKPVVRPSCGKKAKHKRKHHN